MAYSLEFDPLLPWPLALGCIALAVLALALAIRSSLRGWSLRAALALLICAAILDPRVRLEDRQFESDIVLALIDRTASQSLGGRDARTEEALAWLREELPALPNVELRVAELADPPPGAAEGTLLASSLRREIEEIGTGRFAGAVVVTDGGIHDAEHGTAQPAPVHVLLTSERAELDRELEIRSAPAFAVVGEGVEVIAKVKDSGAAASDAEVEVEVFVDGARSGLIRAKEGEQFGVPVEFGAAGTRTVHLRASPLDGELTAANNEATAEIRGVRERLRVLMVSGKPHVGQRTWRNILKSDGSVELVHFTLLRTPDKRDSAPTEEIALVQFPARELFQEKIDQFDLVIFDRYSRSGLLLNQHFESLANYVERGGALLVAAGPEFSGLRSLYGTAIGKVLPARPTGFVLEEGFRPALTPAGLRHPVTAELADGADGWGRWFRQVDISALSGHVLLKGIGGQPLLVLGRAGEGRVAVLASDQAWLWHRSFEGGGPQLELLRRLAHWMMREPALEEETLSASAAGSTLKFARRTMSGGAGREIRLISPDGASTSVRAEEAAAGLFEAEVEGANPGLYRATDGEFTAAAAVGPAHPLEHASPVADAGAALELARASGGAVLRIEDGLPEFRLVRAGRAASGRGWLGVTPRNAYTVSGADIVPLANAPLITLLVLLAAAAAWRLEGA